MAKKESLSNGPQITQGSELCQPTLKNKESKFMNKVMERIDLDAVADTLA